MRHSIGITALIIVGAAALGACSSGSDDNSAANDDGSTPPPPPPPPAANNNAPTIAGSPGSAVTMGEAYSFTPSASDPDGDPLTFSVQNKPAWAAFDAATGSLSGTPSQADIGTYGGIEVAVSDGNLSANLPQFSVQVLQNADGSITLSWSPPTLNDDGSPLNDLAAYKFYYGTAPGNYANEVRVDNPGIATYVIENLTPATYYIVATAINQSGAESEFSNETSKQVL